MGLGDHPHKIPLAHRRSCHSLQTMYKRHASPAPEEASTLRRELSSNRPGNKKSQDYLGEARSV